MSARGGHAAGPWPEVLRRKRVSAPVCVHLLDIGRVRHPEEAAPVRIDGVDVSLQRCRRLTPEDDLLAVRRPARTLQAPTEGTLCTWLFARQTNMPTLTVP